MRGTTGVLAVMVLLAFAAATPAQMCDEEVVLSTGEGSIDILHTQAEYNCCSWTEIEVEREGFTIDVIEREQFDDGPCFCLCCFEVEVHMGGLDPGEYTVTVWKGYYVGDETWVYESAGTWIVEVDGVSDPFVWTGYLPCADTGAIDELLSWGTIKALYR